MRSEFENWFKTTEAYKLIEEMNYFKVDLFTFKEHRSQYQHSAVQIAYMTYQHQQSKVDELQNNINLLTEALDVKEQLNQKLREREDELQKRVDAANRKLNEISSIAKRARHGDYYTDSGRNAGLNIASELEQALKGGEACQ